MTTDCELLHRYGQEGDQAAFAEVVRRNIDLVYSTAVRLVAGDVHQAQDVTQVVFTTLARQARSLSHHANITGWLYLTTKFTAGKLRRGEQRRLAREQEAIAMQNIAHAPEPNWELLRPALDEAVCELDVEDRDAVLLRFFQNKSHREVGDALGLSEDTARKRVERALDKMRSHFGRLGIAVSAELLATAITANSVQAAPVGLAESVVDTSLAGAGGVITTLGLRALFMSKTKTIIAGMVVLAVVATLALIYLRLNHAVPESSVPTKLAQASVSPKSSPQVLLPAAPPAPLKSATADPAPIAAAPTVADPRLDLKTALQDIARLLRAGDNVTLRQMYTPPDELTPMIMAKVKAMPTALAQNPAAAVMIKQMTDEAAQAVEDLETQTPTFNADGDEATYTGTTSKLLGTGDNAMIPRTFVKINGKWYLKWGGGTQSN